LKHKSSKSYKNGCAIVKRILLWGLLVVVVGTIPIVLLSRTAGLDGLYLVNGALFVFTLCATILYDLFTNHFRHCVKFRIGYIIGAVVFGVYYIRKYVKYERYGGFSLEETLIIYTILGICITVGIAVEIFIQIHLNEIKETLSSCKRRECKKIVF
jgi:hypothetical protein